MRAVIQRVAQASVAVEGKQVAAIDQGLLILLGIEATDTAADIDFLVRKIAALRIFDDAEGVMNRSVVDVDGRIIVVSQFTLMASYRKGNRPSYIRAAGHDIAIPLYESFCEKLSSAVGHRVQQGIFGADMKVSLLNDGPVTICMDSKSPE